jgi:DNA-binding response OmpR family regulator
MKDNATPQDVEPALVPPPGPRHARCRILVVDQSSDLRVLYTDALAGPGCQVDVAENGAAAWKALQAHRYHLLVTENDPPELTGDELMRKLRWAGMELPVVMAASGWPMHEPALSPSLQFASTLRKPFALEALLDTVRNVLRASVPMRRYAPRRNRRPNPDRTTAIDPTAAYENVSQEQAVDVR